MHNKYRRNDFLQSLIDLKNGQVIDEKGKVNHFDNFARNIG